MVEANSSGDVPGRRMVLVRFRLRCVKTRLRATMRFDADPTVNVLVVEDMAAPFSTCSFCVQADQHDLLALLTWFREGCDIDGTAELVFPPHLSKKQRAHIHS
jgi:hypothetical protein